MQSLRYFTIAIAATFIAGAAPSFAQSSTSSTSSTSTRSTTSADEEANEKTIQMSQVPKAARDAATKELGTTPSKAKIVTGTSPQEYELEATTAGKAKAVHVKADGTIVKTESSKD